MQNKVSLISSDAMVYPRENTWKLNAQTTLIIIIFNTEKCTVIKMGHGN